MKSGTFKSDISGTFVSDTSGTFGVIYSLRVNPLAEKYYNGTLYAYCLNNPIRFIYQDGKMTVDALGDKGEDFCITLEVMLEIMLEIRKAVICP